MSLQHESGNPSSYLFNFPNQGKYDKNLFKNILDHFDEEKVHNVQKIGF